MLAGRQKLIKDARSLVGTPFRHEGRSATGVDCYGLLLLLASRNKIDVPVEIGYGLRPSSARMKKKLLEYCEAIGHGAASKMADILHMKWSDAPQHLALISSLDPVCIIHADQQVGKVVEHILDDDWKSRVRGHYRLMEFR